MTAPASAHRRSLLRAACAGLACGIDAPSWARLGQPSGPWLDVYAAGEIKTLMPAQPLRAGLRRIEPSAVRPVDIPSLRATQRAGATPRTATGTLPALKQPPTAYVLTARQFGVPPWLMYGVALQESQLAFGRAVVPYPWTLCVRGRGERHASYREVRDALARYLQAGVTNVDCGAMQVNWHWHSDKLQNVDRALDPYPNLAAGAAILRGHFQATGQWRTAVGLYHTGSLDTLEKRERSIRYADGVQRRLASHGVSLDAVVAAAQIVGARHG